MSVQGNMTCGNHQWNTSIIAATTTRAKILVDQSLGGLTLPDSALMSSAMPQITRGGQRVIGGSIASTDSVAKDFIMYRGRVLTLQTTGGTGTLTIPTTSTITRVTGSFMADGWTIGDALMCFGAPPTAFDGVGAPDYSLNAGTYTALASVGILAILTGVTATTLTVNGTPLTVEALTGCRLVRVSQVARTTVAANSGNAALTPNVLLLGNANELDINGLSAADRGISLGASDIIAVAAQATLSALPARIDFSASSVVF